MQLLIPMVASIVFGLAATTLIVLVLVPVAYSLFGMAGEQVRAMEAAEDLARVPATTPSNDPMLPALAGAEHG